MTIDEHILYGFLAVALIVGIVTVIAIRKENTEKAERVARVKAANARYAADRAARAALDADAAAERNRIDEERALNAEAAILRARMRERGVTNLDAGEILDTVERLMPIENDDQRYVRHVKNNQESRENFAAIDISNRPDHPVHVADFGGNGARPLSTEHPKCQSSAYPSSPSSSDTPPSTSPDNAPPPAAD